MIRKGKVLIKGILSGILEETAEGYYRFTYDTQYLQRSNILPVSLTMPLRAEPYENKNLFPFFDGLIPEGWLLGLAAKNWKINQRDRIGLLLATCRDCIGSVHLEPWDEVEESS